MLIWILVSIVVFALAFVRFAPSDPVRWHVEIKHSEDRDFPNGAVRVFQGTRETFEHAVGVIDSLPRTERLAGSTEDGRVTFVTRSRFIGFPDYTTVEHTDNRIKMFARLRFGKSDLGVNGKRLATVLRAVKK